MWQDVGWRLVCLILRQLSRANLLVSLTLTGVSDTLFDPELILDYQLKMSTFSHRVFKQWSKGQCVQKTWGQDLYNWALSFNKVIHLAYLVYSCLWAAADLVVNHWSDHYEPLSSHSWRVGCLKSSTLNTFYWTKTVLQSGLTSVLAFCFKKMVESTGAVKAADLKQAERARVPPQVQLFPWCVIILTVSGTFYSYSTVFSP